MQIGICCSPTDADQIADSGADFIEAHVQAFLKPREDEAAFAESRRAADDAALPVLAANCFLPNDLRSTGPDNNPDGIADYAEVCFRRAREVGMKSIVFGSGGARKLPEGFDPGVATDQFIALLKRLGPIAGEYGVTLVVEPLASDDCNFINSVAEGAAIVEAADHPAVRLLADTFHMGRDNDPPESLETHGALLHHVHIAEVDGRTCPGIAGEDFGPYFRALKAAGYDGPLSMESRFPNGLADDAPRAVDCLRRQWVNA